MQNIPALRDEPLFVKMITERIESVALIPEGPGNYRHGHKSYHMKMKISVTTEKEIHRTADLDQNLKLKRNQKMLTIHKYVR
jgi:hypothetical protein